MKFIRIEKLNEKTEVVMLNRPEVKNAFHPQMIAELSQYFSSRLDLQLIILRGEGTAFCAGADLNWMKEMVNYTHAENMEDSAKLWDMFAAIQNNPATVVAVAQGAVFGGALGLLSCCDYVYAEKNTQFCFSEVKLGLSPAVISDFITQKIPDAFCRPLMLSAEVFSSEKAIAIGLAHKVFEDEMPTEGVLKNFSANGFESVRATKRLLNNLLVTAQGEQRRKICCEVISERRMSAEGQERLKNFLNRKPTK